jgi:hypothetical protein
MKHEDILASVAVLILAGVIVYLTKVGFLAIGRGAGKTSKIDYAQAIDKAGVAGAGDAAALLSGPAIYLANTPWPFGANQGNTLPPTSAGTTLPGATNSDFLGFTG